MPFKLGFNTERERECVYITPTANLKTANVCIPTSLFFLLVSFLCWCCCLFLLCFLRCFWGAQRGPKGSPKGSKIDEKEVQKGYLEKGTKKVPKMMIFMTLECGQSVVNSSKIDDLRCSVLGPFWVSFWRCSGSPNGGQEHQKEVLKCLSKL